MVNKEKGGDPQPEKLDSKTDYEWHQLAAQVMKSRTGEDCSCTNVSLLAAAEREPQAPPAPAFRRMAGRDRTAALPIEVLAACVLFLVRGVLQDFL